MTRRRFYAPPENFKEQKVTLSLEESKHLRDVLRLREADEVFVFDGEGREFQGPIKKIGRGKEVCEIQILQEVTPSSPEATLDLTLAVALLKGEKFDLVVQKAVELGVKKIVPLLTKRADVKLRDTADAEKKTERWRRIALEACKQCGRAGLTKIEMPAALENFVANSIHQRRFLFAERSGKGLLETLDDDFSSKKTVAIIGAEGGWEMSEIELAVKKGFQIVTINGRILRAETAAIVAVTLLQHLLGDLR
jgi:16S rRNA (uracil1498-N3)-methyltransferase